MGILILGAGSFAREVTEMCRGKGIEVVGYCVSVPDQPRELWGRPVWTIGALGYGLRTEFLCAIVSPERERFVWEMESGGYEAMGPLVHPSASVAGTARFGAGVIVSRLVAVGTAARIEDHAIVNRGATIGHDCVLWPFSTVGPGAHLAGGVVVGERAVIGMGALIREGVTIGEGAVVGMGAVVTKDVPPGETWWGVPARRVR